LTKPKVFVASFITAGIIAGSIIILFSFVGIYGASIGVGGNPPDVARELGDTYFYVIALLMMSSSISVVDSTFSSTARLIGLQLMGYIKKGRVIKPEEADANSIFAGRVAMVIMAAIGVLPLFADPSVLSATTISGTMVIGLAPVFFLMPLTKKGEKYPLCFHFSFWTGVTMGIVQVAGGLPNAWNIGDGDFANLLGANIYGSIFCFGFYLLALPLSERRLKKAYTFVTGHEFKSEELQNIDVEKEKRKRNRNKRRRIQKETNRKGIRE